MRKRRLSARDYSNKRCTPFSDGAASTGQVLSLVSPDGERTFIDFLGASTRMGETPLPPSLFAGVKLVHIEGYNMLYGDFTRKAMAAAKASGPQVSFDLANGSIATTYKGEGLA